MASKTWVLFALLFVAGAAHCREVLESPAASALLMEESAPQDLEQNELVLDDQELKDEGLFVDDLDADIEDEDADDEASRQGFHQQARVIQNLRRRVEVQRWLYRRNNSARELEILELTAVLKALRRANYGRVRTRDSDADFSELHEQDDFAFV